MTIPPFLLVDLAHAHQAELRRRAARARDARAALAGHPRRGTRTVRRNRRWPLRAAGALSLTVVVATLAAAAAGAAARETQVGRDVVPIYSCSTATGKGTFVQLQSAEDRYQVPAAGVLTSYRITAGNQALPTVAFRLLTIGPDDRFTVLAKGPTTSVPTSSSTSGAVRIPVAGGELVGLYVESAPLESSCLARSAVGSDIVAYTPADAQTGVPFQGGIVSTGAVLAVSAVLEPDTDRDGYGDATQDGCITDPTTHGSCEDSAPQATIGRAKVTPNGRVLLRLQANEAASFGCAVDSADFRPCASTFRTRLRPGRHVITVVATDTRGNTNPTPAVQRLRVRS